jgi:hypothetical protein
MLKIKNHTNLLKISIKVEIDTVPWKYQLAATNLATICDYKKALEMWINREKCS